MYIFGMAKKSAKPAFSKAANYPDAIRVYVQPWDTGMAPNVEGDICTLATCKPAIRKNLDVGHEWVLALGAVKTLMHVRGGKKQYESWRDRISYAMIPDERLTYDEYHRDKRFAGKIPHSREEPGDNLYRLQDGHYVVSDFVNDIHRTDEHLVYNPDYTRNDLTAPVVLAAQQFWYFGENAPHLSETGLKPKTVETLMTVRRGHLVVDDPETIRDIVDWLRAQKPGVHGEPRQRHLLSEFHL
jgi:hypothetical protein